MLAKPFSSLPCHIDAIQLPSAARAVPSSASRDVNCHARQQQPWLVKFPRQTLLVSQRYKSSYLLVRDVMSPHGDQREGWR